MKSRPLKRDWEVWSADNQKIVTSKIPELTYGLENLALLSVQYPHAVTC